VDRRGVFDVPDQPVVRPESFAAKGHARIADVVAQADMPKFAVIVSDIEPSVLHSRTSLRNNFAQTKAKGWHLGKKR